ncbi:hypothetical protein [Nonomuraea sp. NPDC046570]|uniref:hypothetical protein n=1 Tax=Nonomuraea sp. NPDC046570 TaxID=3155255 RepID=UPI00340559F0
MGTLQALRNRFVDAPNSVGARARRRWERLITTFPDISEMSVIDLVYSNAVIEHVGGHIRRERFADNVRALSPRHWVQVPYRYFPIEPHVLFPGFQFLPVATRRLIISNWPLVHTAPRDRLHALRDAMEVELLSVTEMRYYFPTSRIGYERMGGLIKSIIAVR